MLTFLSLTEKIIITMQITIRAASTVRMKRRKDSVKNTSDFKFSKRLAELVLLMENDCTDNNSNIREKTRYGTYLVVPFNLVTQRVLIIKQIKLNLYCQQLSQYQHYKIFNKLFNLIGSKLLLPYKM